MVLGFLSGPQARCQGKAARETINAIVLGESPSMNGHSDHQNPCHDTYREANQLHFNPQELIGRGNYGVPWSGGEMDLPVDASIATEKPIQQHPKY